jgi:hypothetical protein
MRGILQQPFDRDGVGKADLLQLLDGAHCGSDGEYLTARFHQPAPQFLKCCGLACTGGATDAHGSIARSENEFHGMFLFRSQTV